MAAIIGELGQRREPEARRLKIAHAADIGLTFLLFLADLASDRSWSLLSSIAGGLQAAASVSKSLIERRIAPITFFQRRLTRRK